MTKDNKTTNNDNDNDTLRNTDNDGTDSKQDK